MEKKKFLKNNQNINNVLLISIIITTLLIFLLTTNSNFTGKTIFDETPDSILGKDTYIRENLSSNFGTSSVLRVGKVASGINHRSLLEFNLSSIPSTDTIINSTIYLTCTYAYTENPLTISVYRILYPWIESETTWYNRTQTNLWETVGGTYSEKIGEIIVTSTGTYSFELSQLTTYWVKSVYPNYGLILIAEEQDIGNYKEFASSDSSTESSRPNILIHHSANAPPIISNITTNFNETNKLLIGESANFQIHWTDLESDNAKMYVCDTENITSSGCEQTTYCQTEYSSQKPQTCSYTIQNSNENEEQFFIGMCDSSGCSVENRTLFMNHPPQTTIIVPNGGETINQEQGDFTIIFETLDQDGDELNINLYYGSSENSTAYEINTNLNSSTYCIDSDYNPLTPQQCTYSWDTEGIYGSFYLTITVNDSLQTTLDSSDESFNVVSLIDLTDPIINEITISKNSSKSGENIEIIADITELNLKEAWIELNSTSQIRRNFTIPEPIISNLYYLNFEAPEIGSYSYRVYAKDVVGNTDESEEYYFTVEKPDLNSTIYDYQTQIMPNYITRISSQIKSETPLKGLNATLVISDNFTFLSETPKQIEIDNFSINETKNAIWYLAAPFQEGIYNFSINYIDKYDNVWETENYSIIISKKDYPYQLDINGYTQAETSRPYYVEASFSQNGNYFDPDEIKVELYDPLKQKVIGPIDMTKFNEGKFNYSYTSGTSAIEGQWETVINATKNNISYYAHEFWNLIGGPFDVRNIQIKESAINNLAIGITTENTGGTNKDLVLTWNLTRVDSGQVLDEGSETFMVPANSEKDWTIYPSTNYVGQVKITFLGYYGVDFTEKAGAYKIFSTSPPSETPSSSGGGGGGDITPVPSKEEMEIKLDPSLQLLQGKTLITYLSITNNGGKDLKNIKISAKDYSDFMINFIPETIQTLSPGKTQQIKIIITSEKEFSEQTFLIEVDSDTLYEKREVEITYLQNIESELISLQNQIELLKDLLSNKEDIYSIYECETILKVANETKETEKLQETQNCIDEIKRKNKITDLPGEKNTDYIFWIITWVIILILGIIIYSLIKQTSVIDLISKKNAHYSQPKNEEYEEEKEEEKDPFEDDIVRIKDKLKRMN